jgi:multiple sugar transport system ATP-binding protein
VTSISVQGVTKRFGSVVAVDRVTIDVADGELFVLVGPSGCGKSTMLRLIAGLDEPSEGTVSIGGTDVTHLPARRRDVAMVFQDHVLYPHMTVARNLGIGLRLRRRPRREIAGRVAEVAALLEIDHLLERRPAQLSGGERQRVAIGRAIARSPQAFLMDEPLSNLDAPLRAQLRAELAGLHAAIGTTTLYVTHDQLEAMSLGDRVAVLRGGHLEQVATPLELFHRPQTAFVAGFIGSPPMNLLPAAVEDGALRFSGGGAVHLTGPNRGAMRSGPVLAGIRPVHLRIVTLDGHNAGAALTSVIAARCERVEDFGTERHVHARVDPDENGDSIVAVVAGTAPRPGEHIGLVPDAGEVHLFDRTNGERLT